MRIKILINIIVVVCLQVTVSQATEPRCTRFWARVDHTACLEIIRRLHGTLDALRMIDWGILESGNDEVPGRRLPSLLVMNDGCQIMLERAIGDEPSDHEILRIIDYMESIYRLYYTCAVNGHHQGGRIKIGNTGKLEITMSSHILSKLDMATKAGFPGSKESNSTTADALIQGNESSSVIDCQ